MGLDFDDDFMGAPAASATLPVVAAPIKPAKHIKVRPAILPEVPVEVWDGVSKDYRGITLEQALLLPDGLYHSFPEKIYHQLPYLGSSTLKKFAVNPSTCHDPVEGIPPIGSASHAYSLEGKERFNELYAIMPEFPCPPHRNPKGWHNTSEYREQVEDFQLDNHGKILLTAEEGAAVMAMDRELRAHLVTRRIMNRGANELTGIWTCPETGLRCKFRVDDYPGDGIANDYKTTNSLASFIGVYRRLKYSIQGGFYTLGLEHLGEKIKAFIFCVAEFNEPYGVRTGRIGMPEDETQICRLSASKDEARRLMGLYKESQDRNMWVNYEIPRHIHSLDQIQPHDLLEDWNGLEGRFM